MLQETGPKFGALWSSLPELPIIPSTGMKSAKGRNPSNLCQKRVEVEHRMRWTQLTPHYSQSELIMAK